VRAKRRRTDLLLIDSATSGCAGGYMHGLYEGLARPDRTEVAVSVYYPWPYGLRWFFKYSELGAQRRYKLGQFRLYVRALELAWTFGRLLGYVLRHRVRAVAYALSSNLSLERWFLRALQALGVRVYLICHDVVPFALPDQNLDEMIRKRAKFYRLADRLVVHNRNSVEDLLSTFCVQESRVRQFPFPLFDLSPIEPKVVQEVPASARTRFLFLGHLRPEKGLDVLLAAWLRFHATHPNAELVIAGNLPRGSLYDFKAIEQRNVRLVLRFVSDEEYVGLIEQSDCVVLPYRRGTNSGVTSTVLALRRCLIVSDIPMFRHHPLIPTGSFFCSGDSGDLCARLAEFARGRRNAPEGDEWERLRAEYEARFSEEIKATFADAFGPAGPPHA
jgi:glycosyltransferase involved in cell wall biosynthesis